MMAPDSLCVGVSCPAGETCIAGSCRGPVPPACARNEDCNTGESCIAGSCVVVPPRGCDPPCASGQICGPTGDCTKPCTQDTECGAGQVCRAGGCVNRCDADAECGEGRKCDKILDIGGCVATICSGVSCPAESSCDVNTGVCLSNNQQDCDSNDNCLENYFCNNQDKCERCNNNLDTDKDGKKDCDDECPLDPTRKEKPCSRNSGTTCASLHGSLCRGGGNCVNGVASTRTLEYPCCLAPSYCSSTAPNPALGTVVTTERGACEDLDGDGVGSTIVTLKGPDGNLLTDNLDALGLQRATYTEECTTLPLQDGQPIPFYSLGSLVLTVLLLAIYYYLPRNFGRKKH
jgi:hypothetical protein